MSKILLRIFFIFYLILLVSLLSAWSIWHIMSGGMRFSPAIAEILISFSEFPSKTFHYLNNRSDRRIIHNNIDTPLLLNNNHKFNSEYQLLVSTFSENDTLQIKLLNPNNLTFKSLINLHRDRIFNSANISVKEPDRLIHPLLLKDSSLIFSSSALFRLNKNNSISWLNNSRNFHHSIENDDDSLIWTASVLTGNKFFNFVYDTLLNDAICAIDINSGLIKFEKSVADILYENGFLYLLHLGKHEPDLIHLNDVQPVSKVSKYWKPGDLFISLRHRNTVFLYRPGTNKIIWLKTGPWLAQHDVDVIDSKTIMIFGNDVIRGKYGDHLVNGHNNIYFYNFEKDSVYTPYTKIMKKLNISTKTEGRCDMLPNGDLFIDETNNGKLYIITPDSLKMKFVERIDDSNIKMFNWIRPILN